MASNDCLDVFGIHGVGGIVGALLVAIFASPSLGGSGIWDYVANASSPNYSILGQLWIQFIGIILTVTWSALVALFAFWVADKTIGLRVDKDSERQGLDLSSHGEVAYNH
jgi:Amt family ammonium transporter